MRAQDYVAAVKGGALFPKGARDYSGAALTSPGETTELWARLDPGNYIVICWNADHARTRNVHPFVATAPVRTTTSLRRPMPCCAWSTSASNWRRRCTRARR